MERAKPLTDAQERALLGLSYLWPVHENYLIGRLGVGHNTMEILVERGFARREFYRDGNGTDLPFLVLTLKGTRLRHERAQAKDKADPTERWRVRQGEALAPAIEP